MAGKGRDIWKYSVDFSSFNMAKLGKPYFGLRGGWLTFWITLACGADMALLGYDQVSCELDQPWKGCALLNFYSGGLQRCCDLTGLSPIAQP